MHYTESQAGPQRASLSSARRRVEARHPTSPPGRGSEYIKLAANVVGPGTPVVVYARCSGRVQEGNGNLQQQERAVRSAVEAIGGEVVQSFKMTESGWKLSHRQERECLAATADCARRHGAVLVAESTSRLIRSLDYHSVDNPDALPTVREY